MKTCKRCARELSTIQFPKCSRLKDGLSIYCKDCHADMKKTHRWYSLDVYVKGTRTPVYDRIAAKPKRVDETYERVFEVLGRWIRNGTITARQAEALYLHEVEMFSYYEISEFCGCNWTNVRDAHKKAVERLRKFYGVETA